MKQMLIDIMSAMMPFMKPVVYLGVGLAVAALALRIFGRQGAAAAAAGGAVAIGLFLLACEGMGRLLGFEPTVLFADPMNRQLYRNQFPFWLVGGAILALGWLVRLFSRGASA